MSKHFFILVLFAFVHPTFSQYSDPEKINWPPEYEPANSKFYVQNEIHINAGPEIVWGFLIDALKWESWYEGAENVSIVNQEDNVLKENSIFRWKTMGLNLESEIRQYEPNKLLAWESKKNSIQAYHVWLIVPTENGCLVITEETQNGWLTFFEKIFQPGKLKRLHDIWLAELKIKSENDQSALK